MSQNSFLQPLPKIEHHTQLPSDYAEIAQITDSNTKEVYRFIKHKRWLVIHCADEHATYYGKPVYVHEQIDLPLGFLDWFPTELTDYRKPPSEGGATEFHMTPGDKVVEGETLCIIRNMGDRNWPASGPPPGYAVENASRQTHMGFDDSQTMSFSEHFLFEGGFLDLIRRLGAQYKAGLL